MHPRVPTLAVAVWLTAFVALPLRPATASGAPDEDSPIRSVSWQGNDALVVVGTKDVVVWDAGTGKERIRHRLGSPADAGLSGSPLSPDGKRSVVAAAEKDGIGRIVALEGKSEVVFAPPAKGGPFRFLSWSPDGGRVLFVDGEHVLHLWDAVNGKYVGKAGGPSDDPSDGLLTFSRQLSFVKMHYRGKPQPNNKVDATWGYEDVGSLGGGGGSYGDSDAWRRPLWSADGRALLTMSRLSHREGVVVLWDGNTGEALASLSTPGRTYHQAAFGPAGGPLALITADLPENMTSRSDTPWDEAIGDNLRRQQLPRDIIALRLIDPKTGATLHRLDTNFVPVSFAWSPDSKRLLVIARTLGSTSGDVECWDVASGRLLWSRPWSWKSGKVLAVGWSPDGGHVGLTALRPTKEFGEGERWFTVLDADGKPVLEKLSRRPAGEKPVNLPPLWSPTGDRVFAGGYVFDLKTKKVVCDLFPKVEAGDVMPAVDAAWRPDGKVLAVWEDDEPTVRLVSAQDGKTVRQIPEGKP